jgi:putative ABC transport system permease protein
MRHTVGPSAYQAIRQIRRRPALSAAIIAIMALCIGSCVAIFGMVKAVLLTDWTYVDADRIGIIWHARPNVPGNIGMSPSDLRSYQASLQTFQHVAAVTTRGFNLGGPSPSRVTCARMTAGMFPLLGVAPARGRWFSEEEDRTMAAVVVLSHELWVSTLGGDAGALTREIVLDAKPRRIVGIMPEVFSFPPEGIQGLAKAECWIPASYTPAELAIPSFNHVVIGRLKDGATWAQAGADAHAGAQRIWATYPAAVQSQLQLTARVAPLIDQALGRAWVPLALFAGSVISLLSIGCANVSNLLLSSFDVRRQEIFVRRSLGATHTSIVLQLLCESMVMALIGSVLGAALAHGLLSAMIATNATAFPRLADALIDLSALGAAVLCALVAGILGGVGPALAARQEGDRTRSVARGFAGTAWRRGLIALEVALAVVVLTLAGFLIRSVSSLSNVESGLANRAAITFSVNLPESAYPDAERVAAFRDGVVGELDRIPGVSGVAAASALPIGDANPGVVAPAGSANPADYRPAAVYAVTPDFARTLGIAVKAGRFFEESDPSSGNAAVLNETLARILWPNGDAVGRSATLLGHDGAMTIVGIIGDVRQGGPLRPAAPAFYLLMSQSQPVRLQHFIIRSGMPLARLSDSLRRAVASMDPAIPVFAMRTVGDSIASTMAVQRFNMLVVGVFAVLALLLALTGLYAVLAHSVHVSLRDFGIRQALGAGRVRIVGSVLAQALRPAAVGVMAGAIAATAASELIASLLFGVKPNDPATIASVAFLILIASAGAVLAPALRAARVDPARLLRHE